MLAVHLIGLELPRWLVRGHQEPAQGAAVGAGTGDGPAARPVRRRFQGQGDARLQVRQHRRPQDLDRGGFGLPAGGVEQHGRRDQHVVQVVQGGQGQEERHRLVGQSGIDDP